MPYIGQEAATTYSTRLAVQQFNGDGSTTAFTLNQSVSADQDILVSVDGVIQDNSAYTVSNGTTLTFSPAPSSGTANIFVNYLGLAVGTVTHPATQGLTATTGTFTSDISTPTLGTSNFRAGVNAGNSIASGGNFNTVVGDEAGTALTTGDDNTFIGYAAGDATTTATDNVAVGHDAFTANTTGGDTVAIGANALMANTTAAGNTGLGYQALKTNTEGHSNVAVGKNSLKLSTTGDYNVAVGMNALDANTTADNNTAVGYDALGANTTGTGNVAVGTNALDANTTANNNIAVGKAALGASTTGADNVAIGALALDANTTGGANIAIGLNALGSSDTSSRNVAIGRAALSSYNPSGAEDAYNIAIGYDALTTATTGVENTAVGGKSLQLNTTGHHNTVVGFTAGDAITDGFKNICIGSNADVSAANNQHTIVIGEGITAASNDFSFGKASNVVTNDFDADANWSRSSDERLKKNITNQTLGLDFINDLRTVKYNWKPSNELDSTDSQLAHLYKENAADNEMNTSVVMHNFIAQEVKAALDTAGVSEFGGWKEDKYGVQQVSREMFVIPLVKAIQELSAKIAALEAK